MKVVLVRSKRLAERQWSEWHIVILGDWNLADDRPISLFCERATALSYSRELWLRTPDPAHIRDQELQGRLCRECFNKAETVVEDRDDTTRALRRVARYARGCQ